ncbi:MAG: TRAM domain-containing protein [Alphaproteobacteria bacterium]
MEGPSKRPPGHVHGKTRDFNTAVFPGEGVASGQIARVRVEDATAHTLLARPARSPAA